jgi:uncharacterized protein (TIGR02444 family)
VSAGSRNPDDNPFWRWSLETYARPGVEPLLLALQDRFGFDVNLVLWCCWRALGLAPLDAAAMSEAQAHIADWTANVVAPLRNLRRRLKGDDAAPDGLRTRIKEAELDAERHVQDLLFGLSGETPSLAQHADSAAFAQANLALYARRLGAKPSPALLNDLIANIFAAGPDASSGLATVHRTGP